jgi:hypothetical protein
LEQPSGARVIARHAAAFRCGEALRDGLRGREARLSATDDRDDEDRENRPGAEHAARDYRGPARYDIGMATRLVGWDAIAFAERNGCLVSVRGEGKAPSRDGVTAEEARLIAMTEADRVYVDFDDEASGGTRMA